MTDNAALSGDYVDLRFVKTRKVCQIIIEIPIEQGGAFVSAFGTPNPATGVPVAIARLQSQPATQQAEKPKQQWQDLSRSQQSGIACNDPDFQRFVKEVSGATGKEVTSSGLTAMRVRHLCSVASRTDLDIDLIAADKWDKLYGDFQMWKRGAAA